MTINEIRKVRPVSVRRIKNAKIQYQPLFLNVINRNGSFSLSNFSYLDECDECLKLTGRSFDEWLHNNKLQLTKLRNGWKINKIVELSVHKSIFR